MDPYKTPESNLECEAKEPPSKIFFVYASIALSFVIFLIEEMLYAMENAEGLLDITNFIFILIWAAIMLWIINSIRNRKENPKNTFLILAVIVFGMSVYDPLGQYSIYTGIAEALCFIVVFFLLNQKDLKEWFE